MFNVILVAVIIIIFNIKGVLNSFKNFEIYVCRANMIISRADFVQKSYPFSKRQGAKKYFETLFRSSFIFSILRLKEKWEIHA